MKTTGSAVYNRCRVFCEIASLNNYIIIHYEDFTLKRRTYNKSIIFRVLGVHYILFIFVCVFTDVGLDINTSS